MRITYSKHIACKSGRMRTIITCTTRDPFTSAMAIALNAAMGDPELNWPTGWPSYRGVAAGKIFRRATSTARGSEVVPFLLGWSGPEQLLPYGSEDKAYGAAIQACPAVTDLLNNGLADSDEVRLDDLNQEALKTMAALIKNLLYQVRRKRAM